MLEGPGGAYGFWMREKHFTQSGLLECIFRKVCVCAGTTMFPGIADRMNKEITARAPTSMKVKVSSIHSLACRMS